MVEDLRTDESLGSGKSMVHEYAPVCSFKKKRESSSRKARDDVVKQEQEEEVDEGKKDGCAMRLRGLDADDYDICTSPRQYSYGGPYRRTRLGRKQISKKDEVFQVSRPPYVQKDSTSLSMVHHRTRVKDDLGTVSSSGSPPGGVERLISKEECQKDSRTKSVDGLTVVNSVRSQDSETRNKDGHGLTVVSSVRSQDSEIQTSIATSLPARSDGNFLITVCFF